MADRRLFWTGTVGTAVTAVCCFTPVLVIGFGALGISALLGWADYVLFPALFGFLGITIYALTKGAAERSEAAFDARLKAAARQKP